MATTEAAAAAEGDDEKWLWSSKAALCMHGRDISAQALRGVAVAPGSEAAVVGGRHGDRGVSDASSLSGAAGGGAQAHLPGTGGAAHDSVPPLLLPPDVPGPAFCYRSSLQCVQSRTSSCEGHLS